MAEDEESDPDVEPLLRAHALNEAGRYEAGLELARQASAADPVSGLPHCEIAFSLHQLGRNDEALSAAEMAAGLAPDLEWGHRLRSIILRGQGRAAEALAAARTSVELAPDVPEPLAVLAQAQVASGSLPAAHVTAWRLAELAPELPLSHLVMGQVAIARRDWRLAEEANRRALRMDPLNYTAMNNLGVALQAQGRPAEALNAYQEAARLDPRPPLARDNVVRLVEPAATGQGLALEIVIAIVAPISIPFTIGRYVLRVVRSRRLRARLHPGARVYYDRKRGARQAWTEALVTAGVVFVAGYIALAVAQGSGWTYVATGIPVTVLTVVSAAVAASPGLWWLARWLRSRG